MCYINNNASVKRQELSFFNYSLDKKGKPKKAFDPQTATLLAPIAAAPTSFDSTTITDRMLIPMINEVVRCLEEKDYRHSSRS